jgi:hypothetical protein
MQPNSDERWKFWRDVAVFQLKMFLDNVRDLVLMPVSLVAALIDLLMKGEREGALFYRVLRWGSHSEDVIDVYSAIKDHDPGNFKVSPAFTVDAVIARLEGVVVREVEKGGTAATIKSAMDRAICSGRRVACDVVAGVSPARGMQPTRLPLQGQCRCSAW